MPKAIVGGSWPPQPVRSSIACSTLPRNILQQACTRSSSSSLKQRFARSCWRLLPQQFHRIKLRRGRGKFQKRTVVSPLGCPLTMLAGAGTCSEIASKCRAIASVWATGNTSPTASSWAGHQRAKDRGVDRLLLVHDPWAGAPGGPQPGERTLLTRPHLREHCGYLLSEVLLRALIKDR